MSSSLWTPTRRAARRVLRAILPHNDWSAEFVQALDDELQRKAGAGAGVRLTIWYVGQLVAPRTLGIIRAMRRRERRRETAMGRHGWAVGFGMDIRQAFRGVRREPWAALLILLTLGVGIGSVSAMYGLGHRLFLAGPPHVAEPDEIVQLYLEFNEATGTRTSPWIPYATARAIQDGNATLDGVALYRLPEELADFGERVRPVRVAEADGSYFDVLRTVPRAGRFFRGDPSLEPDVVVLSEGTAIAAFGSVGAAIGRSVQVGDVRRSVVGVAPAGFAGPRLDRVDLWVPMDMQRAGNTNWWVTARLREGHSPAVAAADAQSIHERQDPGRFFQWAREGQIRASSVDADLAGERTVERSIAGLLLVVVGLVLAISWANVLNLLLARIARRQRDMMVRLALGIGRLRLTRLLLAESLLLSLGGGLFSLPVAYGESLLVRRVLLPDIAWVGAMLDWKLLGITFLAIVASGAVLGVLPARHAGQLDVSNTLGSIRHSASLGATRLQNVLATAQVTFSAVLLLCAALFVKSFWTIRVTDLGIDADRVHVVELRSLVDRASNRSVTAVTEADAVYERALHHMRQRGDGTRYAVSLGLPLFRGFGMSIQVPGRDSIPELPGGGPFINLVSDGYFETVGTSIVRGVGITVEDVDRGAPIVVIGESTARALWPDGSELGRCLHLGAEETPCLTVVGVAEDVHQRGYREPASLQVYLPLHAVDNFGGASLLARPTRRGGAYESRLSTELAAFDPSIDYVEVRRLDSFVDSEIRPWRLGAVMLSMAGILAIVVSVAGVFGLLTYVVARRRREIGVRIALGATRRLILVLVLRQGLATGAAGVALGFLGVLASSRWLAPLLFETRVADPAVLVAVAASLITVSVLSCLVPAGQAARVDPVTTLRAEG